MPQLELSWFFINFSTAWLLVAITLLSLTSQNWCNNQSNETSNTNTLNHNEEISNEWTW